MQENILYSGMHYYYKLLQSIGELKKQQEYTYLNTDTGKRQLEELNKAWVECFAGLLEEGVSYFVIRDAKESSKDLIRITIENINYDCKISDLSQNIEFHKSLKPLLEKLNIDKKEQKENDFKSKEKRKKDVTGNKTGNDFPEIFKNSERQTKENINKVTEFTSKGMDSETTLKECQKDLKEKTSPNPIEKTKEDADDKVLERKEEISESAKPLDEKAKRLNSFVFDRVALEIFEEGAVLSEKFELYVFPLNIKANDSHAKIIVAAKNVQNDWRCFVSEKIATITADLWGYEILIRGIFKNGNFESWIVLAGATASNCNMNISVIENRSEDMEKTNWGHIYFKKEDYEFHVIPFEKENSNKDIDPAGLIVAIKDNDNIHIYSNPYVNEVLAPLKNTIFSLTGYWVDDELVVDCKQKGV